MAEAEKKVKGRPFPKGVSGNPAGRPRRSHLPPPGLRDDAAETQLAAMRAVATGRAPETVQQWRMSQWLLEDRKGFWGAKSQLERGLSMAGSGSPGGSSGSTSGSSGKSLPHSEAKVADLGTAECLRLVDELLEVHGAKP